MKTGLSKVDSGFVVVKAFKLPSQDIHLEEHQKYLKFVKSKINTENTPNLVCFEVYFWYFLLSGCIRRK